MPDWGTDKRDVWATDQLTQARLPDHIQAPVRRLLAAWWSIGARPENEELILRTFTDLAQDRALEVPNPQFDWVPVKPGNIRVAEVVRVKVDAYRGDTGKVHNGRVCKVVAIRSGDIIVNSIDDKEPRLESVHHSPFALDKQVWLA